MSWNKKGGFSSDEAIEAANKAVRNFWYNTEPLLYAAVEKKTVSIYPLSKDFSQNSWMIFFVDCANPYFQGILDIAKLWNRQFGRYKVNTLFVIQDSYSYFSERILIRPLFESLVLQFPTVLDKSNMIHHGFQIKIAPSMLLVHEGEPQYLADLKAPTKNVELKIHDFLRKIDPGLPLRPAIEHSESIRFAQDMISTRFMPDSRVVIEETLSEIKNDKIHLVGNWIQDKESVTTEDPNARIYFRANHDQIHIFARSLSEKEKVSRLEIYLDDLPIFDVFGGNDLILDDEGNSYLRIREGLLYEALRGIPKGKIISCRPVGAQQAPLAVYRIYFRNSK